MAKFVNNLVNKMKMENNICGIILKTMKDNVQNKYIVKIYKNIPSKIIHKIHKIKLYISALLNVKMMFGK